VTLRRFVSSSTSAARFPQQSPDRTAAVMTAAVSASACGRWCDRRAVHQRGTSGVEDLLIASRRPPSLAWIECGVGARAAAGVPSRTVIPLLLEQRHPGRDHVSLGISTSSCDRLVEHPAGDRALPPGERSRAPGSRAHRVEQPGAADVVLLRTQIHLGNLSVERAPESSPGPAADDRGDTDDVRHVP